MHWASRRRWVCLWFFCLLWCCCNPRCEAFMRRRDRFLLLISVFALAGEAHALSSDKEQPIHIEADSVVIDDARGVATYRGNVHYSQGSAHLNADEVIVYSADRKQVDKVEAKGSPATFRQRPDNKNEERIVLETDAHLWQCQNEFTGDRIEYRSNEEVVKALKAPDSKSRVQVVIQPRPSNGAAPAPTTDNKKP